MTPGLQLSKALVVAAAIGLATPCIAASSDSDHREISAYALTEAGLAKFRQATEKLSAVPGACERLDEDDDGDEGSGKESLDQMVAKLNAVPGAQAAIQSAGMTTREYVVFMFSMIQSGMSAWAQSQSDKLPPGVSQANVDFFKKHEADMKAIGDNDPCDDNLAEEEEDDT
jgi:hypothetical protein